LGNPRDDVNSVRQENRQTKKKYIMIIDSLRLEKTSKITKSNHQTNTTMPAKPYLEVPHLHIFLTPPGMVSQPPPWAACSNAWPLFQ